MRRANESGVVSATALGLILLLAASSLVMFAAAKVATTSASASYRNVEARQAFKSAQADALYALNNGATGEGWSTWTSVLGAKSAQYRWRVVEGVLKMESRPDPSHRPLGREAPIRSIAVSGFNAATNTYIASPETVWAGTPLAVGGGSDVRVPQDELGVYGDATFSSVCAPSLIYFTDITPTTCADSTSERSQASVVFDKTSLTKLVSWCDGWTDANNNNRVDFGEVGSPRWVSSFSGGSLVARGEPYCFETFSPTSAVTVTGAGVATVVAKNPSTVKAAVSAGTQQLHVFSDSDIAFDASGVPNLKNTFVYAPKGLCEVRRQVRLQGAMACDKITVAGNYQVVTSRVKPASRGGAEKALYYLD